MNDDEERAPSATITPRVTKEVEKRLPKWCRVLLELEEQGRNGGGSS